MSFCVICAIARFSLILPRFVDRTTASSELLLFDRRRTRREADEYKIDRPGDIDR
ncbi:MAG: hypothetical protein ABI262_01290 [Microcoleus sp.]